MTKRIQNTLRSLLLIIPMVFIMATVVSNCTSNGSCDGSLNLPTADDCTAYAEENACDTPSYDAATGVCTVTNCLACDVTVDDSFIVDVDDEFFDDVF